MRGPPGLATGKMVTVYPRTIQKQVSFAWENVSRWFVDAVTNLKILDFQEITYFEETITCHSALRSLLRVWVDTPLSTPHRAHLGLSAACHVAPAAVWCSQSIIRWQFPTSNHPRTPCVTCEPVARHYTSRQQPQTRIPAPQIKFCQASEGGAVNKSDTDCSTI